MRDFDSNGVCLLYDIDRVPIDIDRIRLLQRRPACRTREHRTNMVQGVRIENGYIEDINPATGEIIDHVKCSSQKDVDAAVAGAKTAQASWAARPLAERTEVVRSIVRRLGDDPQGLANTITLEMGKTLKESLEEVADNSDKDEYCALVMAANEPIVHGGNVIMRHPHGVVSICAPWNYPVEEIVLLSIPALIAGNAIVVKPSEVVPLSGAKVVGSLIAGMEAAGHPGLISLVQGDGAVGGYLVAHAGVDMCAFTGSTATGAKILSEASSKLKRVVLECGRYMAVTWPLHGRDTTVTVHGRYMAGRARLRREGSDG